MSSQFKFDPSRQEWWRNETERRRREAGREAPGPRPVSDTPDEPPQSGWTHPEFVIGILGVVVIIVVFHFIFP